jgi:hypothetical protein
MGLSETALRKIGYAVLDSKTDRHGAMVHLVRTPEGTSIAMLDADVDDLLHRRALVHEIIQRDRATTMEYPWPMVARPLDRR